MKLLSRALSPDGDMFSASDDGDCCPNHVEEALEVVVEVDGRDFGVTCLTVGGPRKPALRNCNLRVRAESNLCAGDCCKNMLSCSAAEVCRGVAIVAQNTN